MECTRQILPPSSNFFHCCLILKAIDLHVTRNKKASFLTFFRENSSCPTPRHFLPNTEPSNEVCKYLRCRSQRNLSTETIKMKTDNSRITTTTYSENVGNLTYSYSAWKSFYTTLLLQTLQNPQLLK